MIGLPGDVIEIKDNVVFVNGDALPRERVPRKSLGALGSQIDSEVFYESAGGQRYLVLQSHQGGDEQDERRDFSATTVPDGSCFVMGDSRDNSRDSRQFGFIPLGDIIGEVDYIYLPAGSWSRFGVFSNR